MEDLAASRSPDSSFSVTKEQPEYGYVNKFDRNCESSILLTPVFSMG